MLYPRTEDDNFACCTGSSIIPQDMQSIIHDGITFLEALFLIGWAGSLVVVVISGIEDLHTIFQKDKTDSSSAISGDHEM